MILRQVALNANEFVLWGFRKAFLNLEEKHDSEISSTFIYMIFKGCQAHTNDRKKDAKFSSHHIIKPVESIKLQRDFYHQWIHSFFWTVFLADFSLYWLFKALCIKLESKLCLKFKQIISLQIFYRLFFIFFFCQLFITLSCM